MLKRANVVVVFYDLPVKGANSKVAIAFRKKMLRNGYVFVQKSVYAKIIHNRLVTKSELDKLRAISPVNGDIFAFVMSLSDFKKMQIIRGEFDMSLFADEIIEI